jgi:hypothetical protein
MLQKRTLLDSIFVVVQLRSFLTHGLPKEEQLHIFIHVKCLYGCKHCKNNTKQTALELAFTFED